MGWDDVVTSLSPWLWYRLDDASTATVATDASGNGRSGSYPNGSNPAFPAKRQAPMAPGSGYSIATGGGGNDELRVPTSSVANFGTDLLAAGSFTFGSWVGYSGSTAQATKWSCNGFRCSLSFNSDLVSSVSGRLSMRYDTAGSNTSRIDADVPWNDGSNHLIFCEYDHVADTMSIYMDGQRIATGPRPGTKPVAGTFDGLPFNILTASGSVSAFRMDEWLMFNKVLHPAQHSLLYGSLWSRSDSPMVMG